MQRKQRGAGRREQGMVMVIAGIAAAALILFAALALDVGFVWSARTQGQNVSDAAALAAVVSMISADGLSVTPGAALAAVADLRAEQLDGRERRDRPPAARRRARLLQNFDTETFVPLAGTATPDTVTAVRVTVRQDGNQNDRSPTMRSPGPLVSTVST